MQTQFQHSGQAGLEWEGDDMIGMPAYRIARQAVGALMAFLVVTASAGPIVDPQGVLLDEGTSTFDAASGRHWLDISASTGASYQDMKAWGCDSTCVTGPYAGWTFAQAGDVQQLVIDAGVPYGEDLVGNDTSIARLQLLMRLVGGQLDFYDPDCHRGCGGVFGLLNRVLTAGDLIGSKYDPTIFAGHVQLAFLTSVGCCGDFGAADSLVNNPYSFYFYNAPMDPAQATENSGGGVPFVGGAWLYKAPEPSSLALATLALFGLLLVGHRNRGSGGNGCHSSGTAQGTTRR